LIMKGSGPFRISFVSILPDQVSFLQHNLQDTYAAYQARQ